jgi:hypothetical protein
LEEGHKLYEKGEIPNKLVILIDGCVMKDNGDTITQKGTCFGEEFLLKSNKEKM